MLITVATLAARKSRGRLKKDQNLDMAKQDTMQSSETERIIKSLLSKLHISKVAFFHACLPVRLPAWLHMLACLRASASACLLV
jgi:hypothetical protein